jgi:hypothetical protein
LIMPLKNSSRMAGRVLQRHDQGVDGMARYKDVDRGMKLRAVDLDRQLLPGTFEHALAHLIDHELNLSHFDAHYRNDERGSAAYPPAVLLKVVLFAYSQGLVSSRAIERACRDHVTFMASGCRASQTAATCREKPALRRGPAGLYSRRGRIRPGGGALHRRSRNSASRHRPSRRNAMATVNIYVKLDTSANPPVTLTKEGGQSARSRQASSGDTIKWQKKDNNDSFDISSLDPTGTGQAFGAPTLGGSGQWLKSAYQPPSTNPGAEYVYTLTVTLNGQSYTTTESGLAAENGRPVIRNRN